MTLQNESLFKAIEIIAKKVVGESTGAITVKGKIIERIKMSDSYRIDYQQVEIVGASLGQSYDTGDEVFVLLPSGTLQTEKFILGRTNSREPAIVFDSNGISADTIKMINEINEKVKDLVSDGIISTTEKMVLKGQWEIIKSSNTELNSSYLPYRNEIDITGVNTSFKVLSDIMEEILMNMSTPSNVDATIINSSIEHYLNMDRDVRLKIEEELRKELLYKIEISSSNGNIFKNGIVDTDLEVDIFKGKKNMINIVSPNSVKWTKTNEAGEPIPGWEKKGFTIKITSDDINKKEVFNVGLTVEGGVVATDSITLVDIDDVTQIKTYLKKNLPTSQVFDSTTNKLMPDYTKTPLVLTSIVKHGENDISKNINIKRTWFIENLKVEDSAIIATNHSLGTLTLKENLLTDLDRTSSITCEVEYLDLYSGMTLTDSETVDMSLVVDGHDGTDGIDGQPGKDGSDGAPGKDGVGLSSTVVTYAGSDSGAIAPSKGWTESIPVLAPGKYLWMKTTWAYTDNTIEDGYTVSRIGKDGNTGEDGIAGKDGVGLESTMITYVESTSGTVTPSSGWSEIIPSVSNGRYLWTRTAWNYTDGTSEVGYSVSRMGKDAESLELIVSSNVIRADSEGIVDTDDIKVLIDIRNMTGEPSVTAFPYIGKVTQQEITLRGSGNNLYISPSDWNVEWDSLVIEAALKGLKDIQTIVKISDGKAGSSNYSVVILSTEGDAFKNGVIGTTLVAKVYYGDQEVTDQIDANRFRWSRSSTDKASDDIWNSKYFSGTKEVQITIDDVHKRATFNCDIIGIGD